ncbi:Ig-like domain-containing protein [Candidatus Palauibacter sp.]|uniref:Ig-like domain-containing protein n=1 Tax=Candidatus Palauibacter sp. TaxID=3101350 RepID=UPI003D107EF0
MSLPRGSSVGWHADFSESSGARLRRLVRMRRIAVFAAVGSSGWGWACGEDGTDLVGPGDAPNRAPVAAGTIPPQTVFLEETVTVDVSAAFADPDGDPLTFEAASSDTAVVVVTTAGAEVTLEGAGRGAAAVTVTARDPAGGEASLSFEVQVPNRIPLVVGEVEPQTVFLAETATLDVAAVFADPDGDPLTFEAASSDTAVVVVTTAGAEVTMEGAGRGAAAVTVTARDPAGGEASLSFEVQVPNRIPLVVGEVEPQTVFLAETATLDVAAVFSDPDGDPLTFEAVSSDTTVVVVTTAGAEVTLEGAGRGAAAVTVTARDPAGGEASLSFEVQVPNRIPLGVGEVEPQTVFLAETVSLDVAAVFSDPDGDPLTFDAASSDTAVVVVTTAGAEITMEGAGRGAAAVTVTARDPAGGEASLSFEVQVPNRIPLVVGEVEPQTVFLAETATLDVAAAFSDPDGDPLTFDAASSDTAVVVVTTAGAEITMEGAGRGAATVTVRATDSGGLSVALSFAVTVQQPPPPPPPNRPPVVTRAIPGQDVRENQSVSVDLDGYFSDPEGGSLSYAASSSDDGVATAEISGSDVVVSGVKEGSATVTVRATDGGGLSVAQRFGVTVSEPPPPNQAPVVTHAIPGQTVLDYESFTVDLNGHFGDPDGGSLVYGASSSDDDVATAETSGSDVVVSATSEGSATVTVRATDGGGLSVAQSFDVTVRPNQAPVVTQAIPAQILEENENGGVLLSLHFRDPDGGSLVYGVSSSDDGVATVKLSGNWLVVDGVMQGTATVTVQATDGGGLSASQDFGVTVEEAPPNRAPVVTEQVSDLTIMVGLSDGAIIQDHFSDPDDDYLRYRATSSNPASVTAEILQLPFFPVVLRVEAVSAGNAAVTVTATDPDGMSATLAFDVEAIDRTNSPPEIKATIPDQTVAVDEETGAGRLRDYFTDPDLDYGDGLSFAVESADSRIARTGLTGLKQETWWLGGVSEGTTTVTVTATDRFGLSVSQTVNVTVEAAGGS